MYELKRLGENWLLRRVGGRFVRLSILKDAASVQISENCIIADDKVYEIIENNDEISVVKVPDVTTKCDRSQSKFLQPRNQMGLDYENHTLQTSSFKKEKDIRKLTNNISDGTESDFKDIKKKLEMLNISPPNHETSLCLWSDELADDQQSLSTGSEELIKHTESLDAGSDIVREQEETLKMVTRPLTTKNSASEPSELEYVDMNNEQQKQMGDVTSLKTGLSNIEAKDVKADTSMQVSADVDVSSDDAYSLPSRCKTDTTKVRSFLDKTSESTHQHDFKNENPCGGGDTQLECLKQQTRMLDMKSGFCTNPTEHKYVVDVNRSELSKACGIEGMITCVIENSAVVFRDLRTDKVKYSFPITWIRRFGKSKNMFQFEVGRRCPNGQGSIEITTPIASAIYQSLGDHLQLQRVNRSLKIDNDF